MIQRYKYQCFGEGEYNCRRQKDAEGEFVMYEDYQQLEALCRQLAEGCAGAKDQIEYCCRREEGFGPFTPIHIFLTSLLEAAKKAGVT